MSQGFYKDLADVDFQRSISAVLQAGGVANTDVGTGTATDPVVAALTNGGVYNEAFTEFLRVRSRGQAPVYLKQKSGGFDGDFRGFANDWVNWLTYFNDLNPALDFKNGATPPGFPYADPPAGLVDNAVEAMRNQVRQLLMIDSPTVDGNLDDFGASLNNGDDAFVDNIVNQSWNAFIQASFDQSQPALTAPGQFEVFRQFGEFFTVTAVLRSATAAAIPPTGGQPAVPVQSFEEILNSYFNLSLSTNPDDVNDAFNTKLAEFINGFLQSTITHLVPSHQIDELMDAARGHLKSKQVHFVTDSEALRRGLILELFRILRVILERLQETVQVQAQRLLYLTQVQNNYTELINRVPIYREKPPELIGNLRVDTQNNRPEFDVSDSQILWLGTDNNADSPVRIDPYEENSVLNLNPTAQTSNIRFELTNDQLSLLANQDTSTAEGAALNALRSGEMNYYRKLVGSEQRDDKPPAGEGDGQVGNFYSNGRDGWGGDIGLHFNTRHEIIDGTGNEYGHNNFSDAWLDRRGFAGITLREIFNDPEVRNTIEVEGARTDGRDNAQHPYHVMDEVVYPGVFWFIEQPYDGGVKWMDGDEYSADSQDDREKAREDAASKRNEEINPLRNQWIEQLRGFRGLVKDEAKQAQTSLTSTREAVNQQANLMTSIIQQLSGILQAIFR